MNLSFRDFFFSEEILNKINLSNSITRSGIPLEILSKAHKVLSINDFLENPPEEVRNGYALGLSSAGGMRGIYFHICDVMGLTNWVDSYNSVFGKKWSRDIVNHPDVTDRFLDNLVSKGKFLVFFAPSSIMAGSRLYTQEELNYFIRNPEKLSKVVFVFGTYDIVSPEDYDSLIATNRNQRQRKEISREILKNPLLHMKKPVV
jgi:hypothetical protein